MKGIALIERIHADVVRAGRDGGQRQCEPAVRGLCHAEVRRTDASCRSTAHVARLEPALLAFRQEARDVT
jgi:hypothetical protein